MTNTKPTTYEHTCIELVLDRSGSMAICRAETIGAVNAYLDDARKDDALKEADFGLTIFDSQSIDQIRSGAPINLKNLEDTDFVPRGYTPLYDAIGRGIDSIETKLAKHNSNKAILVIVTDGQENASQKHTHDTISELIKGKQAAGWLVIFLGAGLDAAKQGIALGMSMDTVASIGTNAQQLRGSMGNVRKMSGGYAASSDFAAAKAYAKSANFSVQERKEMGDDAAGAGLADDPNVKPEQTAAKVATPTGGPDTRKDRWSR